MISDLHSLRFAPLLSTLKGESIKTASSQIEPGRFFTYSFQAISQTLILLSDLCLKPQVRDMGKTVLPALLFKSFPAYVSSLLAAPETGLKKGTAGDKFVEIFTACPGNIAEAALEVGIRISLPFYNLSVSRVASNWDGRLEESVVVHWEFKQSPGLSDFQQHQIWYSRSLGSNRHFHPSYLSDNADPASLMRILSDEGPHLREIGERLSPIATALDGEGFTEFRYLFSVVRRDMGVILPGVTWKKIRKTYETLQENLLKGHIQGAQAGFSSIITHLEGLKRNPGLDHLIDNLRKLRDLLVQAKRN
jgi:hypothetical protein